MTKVNKPASLELEEYLAIRKLGSGSFSKGVQLAAQAYLRLLGDTDALLSLKVIMQESLTSLEHGIKQISEAQLLNEVNKPQAPPPSLPPLLASVFGPDSQVPDDDEFGDFDDKTGAEK